MITYKEDIQCAKYTLLGLILMFILFFSLNGGQIYSWETFCPNGYIGLRAASFKNTEKDLYLCYQKNATLLDVVLQNGIKEHKVLTNEINGWLLFLMISIFITFIFIFLSPPVLKDP